MLELNPKPLPIKPAPRSDFIILSPPRQNSTLKCRRSGTPPPHCPWPRPCHKSLNFPPFPPAFSSQGAEPTPPLSKGRNRLQIRVLLNVISSPLFSRQRKRSNLPPRQIPIIAPPPEPSECVQSKALFLGAGTPTPLENTLVLCASDARNLDEASQQHPGKKPAPMP